MDHESSFGILGATQNNAIDLKVGLEFHKTIDYDRRAMRRALVKGAAVVRKEARRLISRRVISEPFEFPGMVTGAMRRAVGVTSRGSKGGWVKIGVRSIPGSIFYPAFLYYGSSKTGLEQRANFVSSALASEADQIRANIRAALRDSLVPR